MKKLFIISALFFVAFSSIGQCESKKPSEFQKLLESYYYDNAIYSEIRTFSRGQYQETYVKLFKSNNYNLVFDVSKMPDGVVIKLFEKGKKNKPEERKLLFNSEDSKPSESNTYSVKLPFPKDDVVAIYEVPERTKPGCVTMLVSFNIKNDFQKGNGITGKKPKGNRVKIID